MYGFEQVKTTLGLNTIFSIVAHNCVSPLGQEAVRHLQPETSKSILESKLHILKETCRILEMKGRLPLRGFTDIRILLNKIEPQNSYLDIKECLEIQSMLEVTEEIVKFFKDAVLSGWSVTKQANGLTDQKQLLNQLQFTIDASSGTIYDNASKELKAIRKKLEQLRADVHRKLERISAKNAEHLQEDYITLRDGRLVLPVREFSVTKISGIVHGQSSSGATKFVEPMSVVNINNEIQELLTAEKREIIKILTRLSTAIREHNAELSANLAILVELDSLQARALYAQHISATFPELIDSHYWFIRQGKHPILLERIAEETVPLDLEIDEETCILIISGPNAGGKTVALKTVGLLQLMLQCAIPLPVAEGSKFPVCKQLFVLIGDKQSIENDLSTFSSHISGLNDILANVDTNALVLIDEIGIGTEPSGGAALAIAVLEKLNRFGILTLVSTHQNQLKLFASHTKGVLNAAMQFDIKHLKPLFILETGVPGSSFTFDICKRYGLSDELIARSRKLEGSSDNDMEKMLSDISEKSTFYQQAVRELSVKQSKLDGLINLYEKNTGEQKKNRRHLEKEAKIQAKAIIDDANKKIEKAIREIKESTADKKVVKNVRAELDSLRKTLSEDHSPKIASNLKITDIHKGQKVRSIVYNIVGNISKVFKNREAVEIEREGLKVTVKLSEIELLNESGQTIKTNPVSENTTHIPGSVSHELDIRGYEVPEALQQLDAYLDNAVHGDWSEVTIIHGKGTGALRQAVQQYLSKSKTTKNFRTGRYGEGDAGVTIVTLK